MVSRILVTIDGSSHSMRAADLGIEMAAGPKAGLVLVNVGKQQEIPDALMEFSKADQFPQQTVGLLELLKDGAKKMLQSLADKVKSAGVEDVAFEVKEGPIARTIVARGKDYNADMIVLGSRGLGDIEGLLRGGVSHRVELLAKCPVVIVK